MGAAARFIVILCSCMVFTSCAPIQKIIEGAVRFNFDTASDPKVILGPRLGRFEETLDAIGRRLSHSPMSLAESQRIISVDRITNPFQDKTGAPADLVDRVTVPLARIAAAANVKNSELKFLVKSGHGFATEQAFDQTALGSCIRFYPPRTAGEPLPQDPCPRKRPITFFVIEGGISYFQPAISQIYSGDNIGGGIDKPMSKLDITNSKDGTQGRISIVLNVRDETKNIIWPKASVEITATYTESITRSGEFAAYFLANGAGINGRTTAKTDDVLGSMIPLAVAHLVAGLADWDIREFAFAGSELHEAMVAHFRGLEQREQEREWNRLMALLKYGNVPLSKGRTTLKIYNNDSQVYARYLAHLANISNQ